MIRPWLIQDTLHYRSNLLNISQVKKTRECLASEMWTDCERQDPNKQTHQWQCNTPIAFGIAQTLQCRHSSALACNKLTVGFFWGMGGCFSYSTVCREEWACSFFFDFLFQIITVDNNQGIGIKGFALKTTYIYILYKETHPCIFLGVVERAMKQISVQKDPCTLLWSLDLDQVFLLPY